MGKERAKTATTTTEETSILETINWAWKLSNARILEICGMPPVTEYITRQRERFFAHNCRMPDWTYAKQLSFSTTRATLGGNRQKTVYEKILAERNIKKAKKKSKAETDFLEWCKSTQSRSKRLEPPHAVRPAEKTNE